MDDLIAFVRARLDDDEAIASRAADAETATGRGAIWRAGIPFDPVSEHLALHDPARVLREVAAKRAHIRAWERIALNFTTVSETEREFGAREALEAVLEADAAVWSDHPDYRPEWSVAAQGAPDMPCEEAR